MPFIGDRVKRLRELLAIPAELVRRYAPGLDERAWVIGLAIGAFGVMTLKEMTFSWPEIVAGGLLGLWCMWRTGAAEWPVYLLAAFIPFSFLLGDDAGGPLPGLNVPMVLMALALIGHLCKPARPAEARFAMPWLNWVIVAFMGCTLASVLGLVMAHGLAMVQGSAHDLLRWFKILGFYFTMLWTVRDRRQAKTVLIIMALATVMVTLLGLWEYLDRMDDNFERSRIRGIGRHPNMTAAFMAFSMLGFFSAFISAIRHRYGWLSLGMFVVCARALLATFSRGAYIAVGVGMLAATWLRHRLVFAAAVALTVYAMINPSILPGAVRFRFGMTLVDQPAAGAPAQGTDVAEKFESSAGNRVHIWRGALQMIREHPWRGMGFGTFPRFTPHYTHGRIDYMDAHNNYLLIAAETGVPTLAVYLGILLIALGYAVWLYRAAQDPLIKILAMSSFSGTIAFMVTNLFTSSMQREEIAGYMWVLFGLVMGEVIRQRRGTSAAGASS